jgi:predicted Rossmann fold nucleotide-binding protein DprA/Smf involved in DNA uptake
VAGLNIRGREVVAPVRHAAAKTAAATKTPKVAHGVNIARGPRTKGVKSAISSLITSGPVTIDGIIERTGFKKNSVLSTLMDLKKRGLAMQDGKAWISMGDSGNSEATTYTERDSSF